MVFFLGMSCDQGSDLPSQLASGRFTSDGQVFAFVTQADPYHLYTLFPKADSVVAGSLSGSTAHQPSVRVSLNATAMRVLSAGLLPEDVSFQDSSVILKEIKISGQTTVLAIMVKDRSNALSNGGRLWAEFGPDGSPLYSIQRGGVGCVGCHSLEQGLRNDRVRMFERQIP